MIRPSADEPWRPPARRTVSASGVRVVGAGAERCRSAVAGSITLTLACGVAFGVCLAAAQVADQRPEARSATSALEALARGVEGHHVGPIGLTAAGQGIAALEPSLTPLATQPRVVIVGGLDGSTDGADAVLDLVRWRLASGPAARTRRRWQLAAVPCALPGRCDRAAGVPVPASTVEPTFPPDKGYYDAADVRESRYVWRWVTMLAPDLVIEVRSGPVLTWRANALARSRVSEVTDAAARSLVGALGTSDPGPVAALEVSGPRADVVAAVREFLEVKAIPSPSPLSRALTQRQTRSPMQIARLMAGRYPATPIMSYIPALSWIGAHRVSALTGDPQYRRRALDQMTPFLNGERPAIAEPFLLTSLAGHQAFYELLPGEGRDQATTMAGKAADFILGQTPEQVVRFATSWTDDMFMATSVLARAAAAGGDSRYGGAVGRLLTGYASRLQRQDRLFVHADSGPHAWGRGNGFAAFGLMEALTHLPSDWPARPAVLDSFRRLMDGMRRHQAPDGSWHQVVDEAGTYREFTVTAMTVAAMARGVRLGWLDRSFLDVVDRGWRAVQVRITDAGELVDVCTGTGAGQNATREYYLHRPAITGADDRGGAMALTAALEVHELRAQPR